jgi:hypothetical protein
MASKAERAAKRQVVAVMGEWQEPHGSGPITDERFLKGIEITEQGSVKLWVEPARAHCPCCLLDLVDLRAALLKKRQIPEVHIEVVGVPDTHRWNAAVNE